jgi:hypothetical protein
MKRMCHKFFQELMDSTLIIQESAFYLSDLMD